MAIQRAPQHSVQTTNLADLLERVLDKGIVIAGDIKVKLVEVELLTIQIRLVICSVDKAQAMGMDWWVNNPIFSSRAQAEPGANAAAGLEARLDKLEAAVSAAPATNQQPVAVPARP